MSRVSHLLPTRGVGGTVRASTQQLKSGRSQGLHLTLILSLWANLASEKGTYSLSHPGLAHSKLLSCSAKLKVSSNPWGERQMLVDTFGAADNCFSEFLLSF